MKVRSSVVTISAFVGALCLSGPVLAMDDYLEQTLVKFCRSTMENDKMQLDRDIKNYRFDHKTVAEKVVCNGAPIMEFAQLYNADKTYASFQSRLPDTRRPVTEIKDITASTHTHDKWYVTVDVGK